MEAIGQLTGGVAHDFNNLLQVIRGNLELLQRSVAGDERGQQRLKNALYGAERAAQLTRQLLAFARRQPLAPKVVNLSRLVSDMADLLRRTLGEAIEVETVVAGGLWNTIADPAQVESAILNLALNARDAMPGGGRLTVEITNAVARRGLCPHGARRDARPVCDAGGDRHRRGHGRGGAGPGVRALLHHQGRRQGHRAWASRWSTASSSSPTATSRSTASPARARR